MRALAASLGLVALVLCAAPIARAQDLEAERDTFVTNANDGQSALQLARVYSREGDVLVVRVTADTGFTCADVIGGARTDTNLGRLFAVVRCIDQSGEQNVVLSQADAGVDAGGVDADVDAGTAAAGTPADEQPTEPAESELPEGHVPAVTLEVAPVDEVMTGDVVTATITVTLPEGDDVAVPHQTLGDLEIHDQRHSDRPEGAQHVFVFVLEFLMLEPGDHELPPIELRVVTADGVVGSVRTESRMIHVGSLIANEPDAQPRPATAPVVVMQDDYTLAWVLGILGIILLTALITWFVARWWRRQPKALPPPPPPRPAWEVATEKIEALRKGLPAAIAEGRQVEIVDGVSDALREYFGNRFDFNGLESTTDEVIGRLRNQRLGPVALEEVIALLGDADLVKFAKAIPDSDVCEKMIDGSLRMVRGTMVIQQPAITTPARPAGDPRSRPRTSGAPVAPETRGTMTTAQGASAADERMLRAASRAAKAAAEAAAAASQPAEPAVEEEGALREDGSRVIPNTNPPPPPGSPSDPGEAADVGRPTPVGFADPIEAKKEEKPSAPLTSDPPPAKKVSTAILGSAPWLTPRDSGAPASDATQIEEARTPSAPPKKEDPE